MNNIYVETMPETCENCEFCEHFEKDAHGKGKHEVACYFNGFLTNALLGDTINAKHCSHLKPLSDRLAEERKRVVQSLKDKIEKRNNGTRNGNHSEQYKDGYSACCCDLTELLDQIDRGE